MTSTSPAELDAAASGPPRAESRSLRSVLSGHNNSFGVIRLVLASAVIFSHAFPLGGWGDDPFLGLTNGQQNFGGMAVLGFFAISGYLITKSGVGTDALQFIWRRALRIFPAYWLVLAVAALIVGPIVWVASGNSLGAYFGVEPGGPLQYFLLNADLAIRQWGIYDTLSNTPYGIEVGGASVMNGSLWTLAHEWAAYLIVWVLVIFGVLTRARFLVPILTAFVFIVQVASIIMPGASALLVPALADPNRLSLTLIFLYGACLALYAHRVPFDWRLAALAACAVLITTATTGLSLIGFPALAYFVMWLAGALPRSFQWIGAKNDYSYGMYVYGFLVQQFTAFLGWYTWGYVPWVAATLAITAGCAWLSWHGVERHALALKSFGPGKGIRFWADRIRGSVQRQRRDREQQRGVPSTDQPPAPRPAVD